MADVDLDPITYSIVAQPAHGTLSAIAGGIVTYTPAANYNGTDSFTFRADDAEFSSNVSTVSLIVTPVNDAPSVTRGPNQGVPVDAAAQTVVNWAAPITAGAPDESGQSLDLIVTNDNNALFSVQPAISPAGS